MNKLTTLIVISSIAVLFSHCSGGKNISQSSNTAKGLKDYYKDYFLMGAAVTPRSLHGEDSALLVNHFNSLTAENAMKMGPIHPTQLPAPANQEKKTSE